MSGEWAKITERYEAKKKKNAQANISKPAATETVKPTGEWAKITERYEARKNATNHATATVSRSPAGSGISSRDDWYRVYRGRVGNQQAKYKKLKTLLETMDDYDIEDIETVKKDLQNQLTKIESSPEYRNSAFAKKYAGKTSAQLDTLAKQATDPDEKSWLESATKATMTDEDYKYLLARETEELRRLEDVVNYKNAEYRKGQAAAIHLRNSGWMDAKTKEFGYDSFQELEERYNTLKGELNTHQKERQYHSIPSSEDYNQKKQVNPAFANDWVYSYINDIDGYRAKHQKKAKAYGVGYDETYDQLNPDEVDTYNYLYATEGKKSADEYISYIRSTLSGRLVEQARKEGEDFAKNVPVVSDVLSSPMRAIGGVVGAIDVGVQAVGKTLTGDESPINFYEMAGLNQKANAIRDTRSQQIMEKTGVAQYDPEKNPLKAKILNGHSWADAYQLGMSMLDSGSMALVEAATKIPELGSIVLGTTAGYETMLKTAETNATDDQILQKGITAGLAEYLGERFSIGGLLSNKVGKSVIVEMLKQGAVEGSEEVFTSIANAISDVIIMRDESEWAKAIQVYTNAGYDENAAFGKAFSDYAIELGWDFVGGFFSGGLMSGGSSAVQGAQNRAFETATLREAAPDLLAESRQLSGDTELGTKIQERIDSGKKVSGRGLRALVAQNNQAIAAQIATQAESKLTERGETGNVADVAQVVGKMATGQRLTRQEMQIFRDSPNAADVLNEINEAEATAETYAQEPAETAQEAQIPTPVEVEGETQKIAPAAEIGQESASVPAPVAEVTESAETDVKAAHGATLYENESRELEANSKQYGEQAEDYIRSFDAGQNIVEYDVAWKAGYELGMSQVPQAQAMESSDLAYLTPGQRVDAYEAGLKAAGVMAEQKEASVQGMTRNATRTRKRGIVRAYNGINTATLAQKFNDSQRKAYKILSTIADVTGIEIVLYESTPEADGVYREAQGKYIRSQPGRIFVDLNSGLSHVSEVGDMANYTMLATFTHEFVHFCENWNPVRYNELRKAVFDAMPEHNINVEERIDQLMADSKGELSREDASREAVAEALVEILPDANFVEQLANEHKTLFQKLLERLKAFLQEIKDYFAGMRKSNDPTVAALKEEVDGMTRYTEHIVKLFDSVAVEAVNRMQEAAMDEFVTYDEDTKSVAPIQYSRRTWTESEYTKNKEAAVIAISLQLGVTKEQARQYIDDIDSIAALIGDDAVRLDYEPNLDPTATVIKPNSEYKWTVDMSTLCAKRLWYTGTFDAIQRRLGNAVFDSDAMIKLRSMMMDAGYEVACGICYVESTRREIGPITQEFINRYKEAQKTGEPIQRINAEGKAVVLKGKGRKDPFYTEDGYTPTMADLNTTDIDLVKRDHPEVYEAYLAFMNARGQAKPKLLETRAEYKGEILKHFKAVSAVKSRNEHGGLRLQSFSDFEVPHMIDMMQIVMDMSRVGLKSQAYTKVPAFADIFGGTGVKINLSLIAKGSGLDANGNLIFDDVEGMPHKEAFRLRDKWSDNVGTILVGKNDDHIRAAMNDPRIDFIIPFHKSSWKESLYGALGLTGYEDYTETQNEKPLDPSRKIKNFDPSEYWDFTKTGDENAEIYLEKCRQDGRQPKFPQFAGEPGYWKLLIDFKMYNNEGVGIPQEVVKPDFDMDAARKVLADYKGGHQKLPVAQDIVERFVQEYEPKTQFQSRPANRLSDLEVLNAAADGLEGLSLTEAEENSLGVMRQKLARLAPISDQIEEHERLAEAYAERDPDEAQKERNRAIVMKTKRTRELNAILAGANGPIMRKVLQKARSIVERQELTEYREARHESELAKRYKARIEKDVNELIAWGLKPDTKNALKHIPEGIKGPVMDFLETIDFASKRKLAGKEATQKDERFLEKMATLKKVLEPMRPNGEENLDKTRLSEEFFVKLDDLSNNITRTAQAIHSFEAGVIVNEMESSDLKRLADIIKGLKQLITKYNRTYKNAMYESIDKAGENSVETMQKMKPLKSNAATEFLEFDQTRPAYIFERFGEGGKSIWQELQNGQSRFGFMAKEIIDFSEKTFTAKEVKAWEKEVKTIKLSDDSTVEMTIAQIMSLYKLQAREQALGHLLGNGIRIPNYKIGNKKYTDNGHFLNQEDIDKICGVLTARQKAVADKLQTFMQETGSQWGNEVTMVRFGERLFGEKNYFPIHSDGGNIPGTLDEHLESQSLYAMLNMGFTKRTQEGANNRIIVHSIFDEYASHMSNMAKYNAFALPVLDTLRWLNYTDEQNPNIGVRQEMARVYGRRSGSDKATAELFVTNLLKALNGTENASLKKTEQTAIRLLGRYNRAQVAANLSVAIQQPLSVIRSVEEFGAGSLIVAMGTNTKAIRKNWKEMEEHSGIAVWKQLGFYDINISRGLSSMIKHDESTVDKLTEWSMGAASFADRLTWGWMWEIAKQDVKRKKKLKPTDNGYWDAVTQAFEDVIFKTQVVDSPLTKTEAMRNNSFWAKSVYSFMSEPITALSMTTNAVSQFRRGIAEGKSTSELWRTNGKKMGRTFMVNAVSIIFNAAITAALRDALRDDDEYENYGEKFMQAFRKNLFSELVPLNNIPELSGVLNGVLLTLKDIGVIEGEFADSIFEEKSTTESILDAIKNAVYIPYQKIWGKGSNYTWYGAVYNALKAASGITGLPAASGIRELVTMWNNTMAPILGKLYPKSEWVLRTYEPDPKQEIREVYESGYLTDEEALEAMKEKKVSVPDSYLKTPEVAYKGYLRYWAYKSEHPKDDSVEDAWFIAYGAKGVDTAGIQLETYLDYRKKARNKKNERKTWTDEKQEETTEKEVLLEVIDSMRLTDKQKDALYAAEGWSPKTISEAPWH